MNSLPLVWGAVGDEHTRAWPVDALVPAPADLEWLWNKPKSKSESYMYWSIAEGGRQFDSDMPAFKSTLPKKDIWSVIAYVRAGMPRRSP